MNDDATVNDDVTGLVWEQYVPEVEVTWSIAVTEGSAQAYCQNLRLGNSSNWRVPTLPELFSLVDLGTDPTIDAATFPNTPASAWFWSSTAYDYAWVVYFLDGSDGYGIGFLGFIRCVH